jgi:formylglycine-generating enzyme required for sulfatase activity
LVYLAHDEQLQRLVAIKVPHRKLVSRPEDADAYLTEARTVANLDHPHIVPVFDVGSTEDCPCYVISKFIDGTDLATKLKHARLPLEQAVELVATVAEALHHAHKHGLVHRDIKPGNILLDNRGKPFVADFGLALREQDVGQGPRYVGTPAYMSPEQAGGEGHRVDGRSDIFSLGVVLYELLTRRRPFRGDSQEELLEQITSFEPRPPRQYDDRIPKELERICHKALAKRAVDRYSTAEPWTLATLKEVGGTEGVGVTFLEETFGATTAPPEHRYHQKAARAVLRALLPEAGTDIKGHMRSYAELLAVSRYASRPRDFDDLLRILDGELRLLTPTDPEGQEREEDSRTPVPAGAKYYHLTHDYLVPSLRDWLTRKQKETRQGRAELLLADRAAVWNARPENRPLPTWWEWATIRLLTRKKHWTPPQQKMMRKASRYHVLRSAVVASLLAVATLTGLVVREQVIARRQATHAAGLVQSLLKADTAQVPAIVSEMAAYRQWTDPLLREENAKAGATSRPKLHTSLALLPVDATQVDYLYDRLLMAEPGQVPVLREALAPHRAELVRRLWTVVKKPEQGKESQRLRAAAALATYDPESEHWARCSPLIAQDLVRENLLFLGQWSEVYRPVKRSLLTPLATIFRDQRPEQAAERTLATNLLADYAADQPQLLADLLLDADEKQFAVLYPTFRAQGEQGLPVLTSEIAKKLTPGAKDDAKEKLAKRQANAAVTLLRMNQPAKVWPLPKHSPDPRLRSYLIHRLRPLGADAGAMLKCLDEEFDLTIRRALILSLGEYSANELAPAARSALLAKLQALYRTASDPGLHAAAEWLLRQWHQEAWLVQANGAWAKDQEQRTQRLRAIKQALVKGAEKANPQWYVNGQGQTMVVISGPVEFQMGSPGAEAGREGGAEGKVEAQHRKRIGRSFAIAAKEVTVEQFLRFRRDHAYNKQYAPTSDCPVIDVTWYEATAYCNWLSQQEGLPEAQWCYRPAAGDKYEEGMQLAPDYLRRTGYRLPSEAEWEYACRAGTLSSRYYGETEELLGQYAWYSKNSLARWMLPCGSLKPNDLGLFDMLGNALEWCQEGLYDYRAGEDAEDKHAIQDRNLRVLRGGSFIVPAVLVRSADRNWNVPADRLLSVGFRPARTFR